MSSARREEMKKDIIPDMVVDPSSGKRYLKAIITLAGIH
jgi:hypothetical protein